VNAIETVYRGSLFRSRLEARWAAFFDLFGWDWVCLLCDGISKNESANESQ
jgi:hypothetical protein